MTPLEIAAKAAYERIGGIKWEDCPLEDRLDFIEDQRAAFLAFADAESTEAMKLSAHFPAPFEQSDPVHIINAERVCKDYIRAGANEKPEETYPGKRW